MQLRDQKGGAREEARSACVAVVLIAAIGTVPGCAPSESEGVTSITTRVDALTPAERHGLELWFTATFGGERMFGELLPAAPFHLALGFEQVLTTPRAVRFDTWGVVNDPDCTPGDASTGFLDRCPDPNASGVVGIRKFQRGDHFIFGVTCAGCHAGFDPERPPQDANAPRWTNIHPTIGNQYLQTGKVFRAELSPHDPRYQVFQTWAPGTVDTTAIESDDINNPGIITPFFNLPDHPFFDLTLGGTPLRVHRVGQGGEDDVGCERAALRVYFNIGMCAAECMVGHLANGPGGTQTPIDLDACRAVCPELSQAEASVGELCAFMQTTRPPKLERAPGGAQFIEHRLVRRGKEVFEQTCASCHSNGRNGAHEVYSDDAIHPATEIGTHSCRSRTTNWTAGHIWAAFSSDQYKARPTGGPGFYRDVPLLGLWATAPFFHNNRLGKYTGDPSVQGRMDAFEDAARLLLHPEARDLLGSIQRTTDSIVLPVAGGGSITLPPGTPVALFSNRDRTHPQTNLCPDLIENQGHTFGANLAEADKRALIEFLKTL